MSVNMASIFLSHLVERHNIQPDSAADSSTAIHLLHSVALVWDPLFDSSRQCSSPNLADFIDVYGSPDENEWCSPSRPQRVATALCRSFVSS